MGCVSVLPIKQFCLAGQIICEKDVVSARQNCPGRLRLFAALFVYEKIVLHFGKKLSKKPYQPLENVYRLWYNNNVVRGIFSEHDDETIARQALILIFN